MVRIGVILFLSFIPCLLRAQEPTVTFFPEQNKNERFDAGVPFISGMIISAFSPEINFNINAVGAVTLKTKRNNPYLSYSVIPLNIKINPQGSMISSFHPVLYWLDDLVLVDINTEYRMMVDNYWGIGTDLATTVEKSESTTEYHRKSFLIQPELLFRIMPDFYGGLAYDIHSFHASNLSDLMLENPEILSYGTDIFSSGLGFVLLFDKRNILDPATSGFYVKIKVVDYLKPLKSYYAYQKVEIDYRHFLPIIRHGSILALQVKSSLSFGNIPWTDMPQPGGSNNLRGIYQGQFRDKNSIIILAEYRHFFTRPSSDELSRHGFAFWLGGGTVFPDISGIKYIALSTGGGYRYRMQPNITLRIDIGFSADKFGIYLGLNEAF